MADADIDFSKEPEKDPVTPIREPWHPEKAKMHLAAWVLASIFFIFVLTFISNHLAKIGWIDILFSNALFELCKTGLLPIVGFILGHYFNRDR